MLDQTWIDKFWQEASDIVKGYNVKTIVLRDELVLYEISKDDKTVKFGISDRMTSDPDKTETLKFLKERIARVL